MNALILASLLFVGRAHAALTIQGVEWLDGGVVKVSVANNGGPATAIEVPLEAAKENSRTSGLFTATIKSYPAVSADERSLVTIILSQAGADTASLYLLREKPDHDYEYANTQPILDDAPSIADNLTAILKMLKAFNSCTPVGALEGLVRYKKGWPDRDVHQFAIEVEQQKVKRGEGNVCAQPDVPKPAPAPVAAKPATPKPAPRPAARPVRRPQNPYADPYGGYGDEYGYGTHGGYPQRGGYGGGGGYQGGYGY